MDHLHCGADGSAIHQIAAAMEKPKNKELDRNTASQDDSSVCAITQRFQAEVNQVSVVMENVNFGIELLLDGTLLYKREHKPGKHANIHYDSIVNSKCRICNNVFPSPFQARMFCCEAQEDFPWPVTYTGECKAEARHYDSMQELVQSLQFVPTKDKLVYHCPFVDCNWTSSGSPNYRHVNEQHLLMHAKDEKQPVLCIINDCGLYIKRPTEKLKNHQNTIHGNDIEKWKKPKELLAPAPVLLAALDPKRFYEAGLKYYKEEYEYKARKGELTEEEKEKPVLEPPSSSRKRSKAKAVRKAATKAYSSRKRAYRQRSNKSKRSARTVCEYREEPRRSKRRCAKRNFAEEEVKSEGEIVEQPPVISDPPLVDLELDNLDDPETSCCVDYFENLTEILGDSSTCSIATAEDSLNWCNLDEDESFVRDDTKFLSDLAAAASRSSS